MALFKADATHLNPCACGGRAGVGRRDNRQRRQPDGRRGNSAWGWATRGPSLWGIPCCFAQRGLSGVQLIISRRPRGLEGRDQPSLYG